MRTTRTKNKNGTVSLQYKYSSDPFRGCEICGKKYGQMYMHDVFADCFGPPPPEWVLNRMIPDVTFYCEECRKSGKYEAVRNYRNRTYEKLSEMIDD